MNLMLIIAFLLAVVGKTGFMLDDESKEIIYIEDDNSVSQEKEKGKNNQSLYINIWKKYRIFIEKSERFPIICKKIRQSNLIVFIK